MLLRRLLPFLLLAAASSPVVAQAPLPAEPVNLPQSGEQGLDMIYVDRELAPRHLERDARAGAGFFLASDDSLDLLGPANPMSTELRRALVRYRMTWGSLPQIEVPDGPLLRQGDGGERVALLRERLGLFPAAEYDGELAEAVRHYQETHGLRADGVAGADTLASINRGAEYYEQLLLLNLERARRLPSGDEQPRYILVDAGEARLHMVEDGRIVDSMKVIVGKPSSATPMMAALLRYSNVHPYWNVPPDLVQNLIAPRVVSEGLSYLERSRYEVLSDWTADAQIVDPETIDWTAVASGATQLRVRQRPGPGNFMGNIKFMMPNDYGIYLHDTPDKALFQEEERWLSNGCVRVEDPQRLAAWLHGEVPTGSDPAVEEQVPLPSPVPVYITYLTASASPEGVRFRKDPYGRDAPLMARLFDRSGTMAALN